LSGATTENE